MTAKEFQAWLNTHGAALIVDGAIGPRSKQAAAHVFCNPCVPAVNDADVLVLASRLGCSTKQIRAVAKVESGGSAFDSLGRPKILFERHLFDRATGGEWSVSSFSNPTGGGYSEPSWTKLFDAAAYNVDAAFGSASWGRFQVLGMHWQGLGYPSALEMAYSAVTSETAHYEMLARYIERNNLSTALAALSTEPANCVAFAKGYNGAGYKKFQYDTKLAEAMK